MGKHRRHNHQRSNQMRMTYFRRPRSTVKMKIKQTVVVRLCASCVYIMHIIMTMSLLEVMRRILFQLGDEKEVVC